MLDKPLWDFMSGYSGGGGGLVQGECEYGLGRVTFSLLPGTSPSIIWLSMKQNWVKWNKIL